MKFLILFVFVVSVFLIIIANFLLVFGFFNPFLEPFISNINSFAPPDSFSALGESTAITSGLLSALAIILALWAIVDQKNSTKQSLDMQNSQLFCQNILTSLETLRNACIVEMEMLNGAITNYIDWYSLNSYTIKRIVKNQEDINKISNTKESERSKFDNEKLAKAKQELADDRRQLTSETVNKKGKTEEKVRSEINKTVNCMYKRNMYRRLHSTITSEINSILVVLAVNDTQHDQTLKSLILRISEEMNKIKSFDESSRKI